MLTYSKILVQGVVVDMLCTLASMSALLRFHSEVMVISYSFFQNRAEPPHVLRGLRRPVQVRVAELLLDFVRCVRRMFS